MPADGTIVAAHCHERRYRHIPFFRQLADEQARIVLRRIISGAQCAQKVEPLIGVIHANAWAQAVDVTTDQVIGYALPTANYTRSLSCRNVMS